MSIGTFDFISAPTRRFAANMSTVLMGVLFLASEGNAQEADVAALAETTAPVAQPADSSASAPPASEAAAPPARAMASSGVGEVTKRTQREGASIKIAVLDLAAVGDITPEAASALSSAVAAQLDAQRVFDVITESDVRNLIDIDRTRSMLGGDDQDADTLGEIGKALAVDYLVGGVAQRSGETTDITLSLWDLNAKKALRRELVQATRRVDTARVTSRATNTLVRRLLDGQAATVVVNVSEEGATVIIDGDARGSAPLAPLQTGSGPRTVTAKKDGFIPSSIDVNLRPGQTVAVNVILVPSQETIESHQQQAWIFRGTSFAVMGAGVLTFAAGAAFYGWGLIRQDQIADATGQKDPSDALRVQSEEFAELQVLRFAGYIGMGLVAPLLVGAGATMFFLGADPNRYDTLVTNASEGE